MILDLRVLKRNYNINKAVLMGQRPSCRNRPPSARSSPSFETRYDFGRLLRRPGGRGSRKYRRKYRLSLFTRVITPSAIYHSARVHT